MKKQLLILSLFLSSMAGAQIYVPMKDFQDQLITSGGWQSQVVLSSPGSYDWGTSDLGSPGNFYGKASGYNGSGGDDTELWLISPQFDLATAIAPTLDFRNATNYSGPALALKISTDYDGTSDPSVQGNWTDISSMVNWSGGGFSWVDGGPINLSAYNSNNSVYIAFVYTSTTAAGAATWEVDEIVIQEPVAPSVLSVYDIQYTTDPGGASDYNGSTAIVEGIVVAESSGAFNSNDRGYWIQDGSGAWHGVFVWDTVNTVAIGDSVTLTGKVNENFSQTIIKDVSSLVINNSGNTLPAAAVISTADANTEPYEGVLVTVTNATCTNPSLGFGQWEVNDGTGAVLVDDVMFEYLTPVLNDIYKVTGPLYYTYTEYKILPRDQYDVETLSGISELTGADFEVYPNPSNGVVNISNTNGSLINISTVSGKHVMSTTDKQVILSTGIYLFEMNNKVKRVIVK